MQIVLMKYSQYTVFKCQTDSQFELETFADQNQVAADLAESNCTLQCTVGERTIS